MLYPRMTATLGGNGSASGRDVILPSLLTLYESSREGLGFPEEGIAVQTGECPLPWSRG